MREPAGAVAASTLLCSEGFPRLASQPQRCQRDNILSSINSAGVRSWSGDCFAVDVLGHPWQVSPLTASVFPPIQGSHLVFPSHFFEGSKTFELQLQKGKS